MHALRSVCRLVASRLGTAAAMSALTRNGGGARASAIADATLTEVRAAMAMYY
jgi:hypothetical protein